MKSVKDLRNPDVIDINGEKYQVVDSQRGNSLLYHKDIDDVEYKVDLIKIGSGSITPTHYITYFGKSDEIRLFRLEPSGRGGYSRHEVKIKNMTL
ncbi:MAG TPA: hypothetical protein VLD37_06480 [Candidatus Bilamarchaeum sp.]|nr:hypothetical protein [Candidatus Bilamarchaeum sp.]